MSFLLDTLQTVTGVFVVVYDGQHALRFTLGRAGPVVGPGVHFKLPIVQDYQVEETKHTTLDLEPQVIQLADDLVYEVDCKVVYQIVDLRRAIVEIDELVTGLRNRVVLAVQREIGARTRESIRDSEDVAQRIHERLAGVEDEWGVRILQLGFSNFSPSPATLEITQLDLLAREKLALYERFREAGLGAEEAVALVSGAVVSVAPDEVQVPRAERRRADEELALELAREAEEAARRERRAERARRRGEEPPEEDDGDGEDSARRGERPR